VEIKSCLAIISDIHANYIALERVLAYLKVLGLDNPRKIVCLGDVIGYGPKPKECVQVAKTFGMCLSGNHESYLREGVDTRRVNPKAIEVIKYTKGILNKEEMDWLTGLPPSQTIDIPKTSRKVTFTHYAPGVPDGYVESKEDTLVAFKDVPADVSVTFTGHTHKPAMASVDSNSKPHYYTADDLKKYFGWDKPIHLEPDQRYIVNVGAIGQPRDGDERLSLVLYDMAEHSIRWARTDYDIEKTVAQMEEAELPESLRERLLKGL
jgi:predicted phosphodiesterase